MQNVILPRIRISWATPTGSGTFVAFAVYRKIAGAADSAYVRIAIVIDETVLLYDDYAAAPYTSYQYAVTQHRSISGDVTESEFPDPVEAMLKFNWTYIHDAANPESFVLLFGFNSQETVVQDVQVKAAWGRSAPTAFIGELNYSTLRLSGLPDVHRGPVWEALRALAALQETAGITLCLRNGVAGTRYFGTITGFNRRSDQGMYAPDVDFSETAYEEAV